MPHPITFEQAREIAEQVMPTSGDNPRIHASFQMNAAAWYFVQAARDGGSVLIDPIDGTFLFAGSAVGIDQHVAAYLAGERTSPAELKVSA